MSQINVTKSSPRDYDDNRDWRDVADYTKPSREFRPVPVATDWRVIVAWAGVGVVGVLLYFLWRTFYCWGSAHYVACETIASWEPTVIGCAVLLGAVLLASRIAGKNAIIHATAQRTNLVLDRFGNQVPANLFQILEKGDILSYLEKRYAADVELKRYTAQFEQYLSVNTLSGAGSTTISTNIDPQMPLLPVVSDAPVPTPDTEWLDWIDRTPHLMIAGRTEAGKTTMAEAVIAQRASAGELLYVLDPHYQPGKWCGLPAVGGGRGYSDVMEALGLVLSEMDARYKEFDRGRKTEDFDRLTVFIDEVPALVEWCFDGKRIRDQRWMSFAKQLGSEARKVRISVILMTQSPLVQDIQINSRMRNNFTRIALGDQTGELVSEAREPRRSELEKMIEGQRYTAAMEYQNKIYVLDTTNVPTLARRSVVHLARVWEPITLRPAQPPTPPRGVPGKPVMPESVAGKSRQVQIAWYAGAKYTTREILALIGGDYNEIVQYAKIGRKMAGLE